MKPQPEAAHLVSVGARPDGRDIKLSSGAAAAWARMRADAAASGIELAAISGFRSIERQGEIIRGKLAAGEEIGAVLRVVAAPGYSEHHTGDAIDIGVPGETPLTEDFERTPAFEWLKAHAMIYGFHLSFPRDNPHGIAYEPWHWRFSPRPGRKIRQGSRPGPQGPNKAWFPVNSVSSEPRNILEKDLTASWAMRFASGFLMSPVIVTAIVR